jgi:hypothetical protein
MGVVMFNVRRFLAFPGSSLPDFFAAQVLAAQLLAAQVFAVALLAALASGLAPQPAQAFTSGAWSGGPANDANGRFLDCAISTPYRSGITLGFVINRDYKWGMILVDPAWNLKIGTSENVSLRVDRRGTFGTIAKVITKDGIVIPLEESGPVIDAMRYGSLLDVDTGSGSVGFVLTGTSAAIARLAQCVNLQLKIEADNGSSSSAFASLQAKPAPAPAPAPEANGQDKLFTGTEAVVFISNLLSDAGITNYTIVDPSKNPVPGFDVVWKYQNGLIGGLAGYKDMQNVSLDEAASEVIAGDSKDCKGEFASGKKNAQSIGSVQAEQLFTACTGNDSPMEIHYTLFKTDSGHVIQIATIHFGKSSSNSESQDISQTADAFLDASVASDVNK